MPDDPTVKDPYYRYDPLSYRRLWEGLMSGVGQTAQTAESPHYKNWGSLLEVADAWRSISEYLDSMAGSMMVSLLGLREAWTGWAAEQHEWRMSYLMTWMSTMAREADAIRTGLMLMSNYLDEAQAEGVQVPCPKPRRSGSIWGDIVGYSAVIGTLGAAQLIPARVFGMSMTQPGSERRSPEMARVVANLAMNYLLTERKYWNGPLLHPLSLDPREQPTFIFPRTQTDGDGSGTGDGDGSGTDDGDGSGTDDGDGSGTGDGDGSGTGDGDGDGSGLAGAGGLGSRSSSFGSGSWPQPASAPMIGAVPGVLGAERLVVPAGSGGPGAGGAGPVAPPMMGMMGAGAAGGGNSSDKSGRPTKFWREDEIEWSRDEHAQWVDPDDQIPSTFDKRRA